MSWRSRNALTAWFRRTPVQTFVLCPLAVIAVELELGRGHLTIVPTGAILLAWGYAQYRLVGLYRLPRAGGTAGMDAFPDRIIDSGPYRYTRNPMYLGHVIFLLGLAVTFWSFFGLAVFAARTVWFHRRILADEERLQARFGDQYRDYRHRVRRWIPGLV